MSAKLEGAPSCVVCGERVYFGNQKIFQMKHWHMQCFKCGSCSKQLETGTANVAAEGGDSLSCNKCLRDNRKKPENRAAPTLNKSDAECCPRCGKRVYFAEQVLALKRKWHKSCFSCGECNKKVDSTSASDHDGELYCKSCYGKKFGPKGYGFSSGAGTMLSMDDGTVGSAPVNTAPSCRPISGSVDFENLECCPRCGKRVYFAEQILALSRKWHKSCFTCQSCSKKVDSISATDHDGSLYCRPCHGKQFGPKGYGFAGGAGTMLSMDGGGETVVTHNSGIKRGESVNHSDPESCPRCGKVVFFAEQVLSLSRKWHKSCFSCNSCKKKVDSTSATDHEGELYCSSCHVKLFGPKGYGFAGGAGTMLSMDTGDSITRSDLPYTESQRLDFD